MNLSIKKIYQFTLFSLSMGIIGAPLGQASKTALPDIEDTPTEHPAIVRSAGNVVDDFEEWYKCLDEVVLGRYNSDAEKVDFLLGRRPNTWQETTFTTDIIPKDTGEFTTKQVMDLLGTATRFGKSINGFVEGMFEMFDEGKLESWIQSKDPTLLANARLKMPQVFFMIAHAYPVVLKIAFLKPTDLMEGSDKEAAYLKALYGAYDAFSGPYVMNIHFVTAMGHVGAQETHELFVSSLLNDVKRTAIEHLSHPYYRREKGVLSREAIRTRLQEKEAFLGKALPNFDFGVTWFDTLEKAYASRGELILRDYIGATAMIERYMSSIEVLSKDIHEKNEKLDYLQKLEESLQSQALAQQRYTQDPSEVNGMALEKAKSETALAERRSPAKREAATGEEASILLSVFNAEVEVTTILRFHAQQAYNNLLKVHDKAHRDEIALSTEVMALDAKLRTYGESFVSFQTFHTTLASRRQEMRQELGLGASIDTSVETSVDASVETSVDAVAEVGERPASAVDPEVSSEGNSEESEGSVDSMA